MRRDDAPDSASVDREDLYEPGQASLRARAPPPPSPGRLSLVQASNVLGRETCKAARSYWDRELESSRRRPPRPAREGAARALDLAGAPCLLSRREVGAAESDPVVVDDERD